MIKVSIACIIHSRLNLYHSIFSIAVKILFLSIKKIQVCSFVKIYYVSYGGVRIKRDVCKIKPPLKKFLVRVYSRRVNDPRLKSSKALRSPSNHILLETKNETTSKSAKTVIFSNAFAYMRAASACRDYRKKW